MLDIKIVKTEHPKQKPQDESKLGFGKIFSDHMFVMDYQTGKGWHSPRIVPYEEFSLFPSAMVYHYGQAIFEGMKAFKTHDDRLVVFRTRDYLQRFNRSADILCIPNTDVDQVQAGLYKLLEMDKRPALFIQCFKISRLDPERPVKSGDRFCILF